MKAKAYFKSLSTTVIIMNVFLGLGAIFLMERIIPIMDGILEDNAYTVLATLDMTSSLSDAELNGKKDEYKNHFWKAYDTVSSTYSLEEEKELIRDIKNTAEEYWSQTNEETVSKKSQANLLIFKINVLSKINLKAMAIKNKNVQSMGLTGAWALGILLLLSVGIQLLLRANILKVLIDPVEQLVKVLNSYNGGNKMRRCLMQKDTIEDIKEVGTLLNGVLDQLEFTKNNQPDK